MQMMSAKGMYGKSVEKAFTFKVEDYDMVHLFLLHVIDFFFGSNFYTDFFSYQIDCIPHLARSRALVHSCS
jgi:hypothetical protein